MTLEEIYSNGSIHFLFKKGLLDSAVLDYFRYYETYHSYRSQGKRYSEAVLMTAIDFNRSERTIKRAIKVLSQ